MKRLILIAGLLIASLTSSAQFYQLRYDSVRVVSKFKLGAVTTGASTDSLLTKKANGGVYKIAQDIFATTSSLSGKANLSSPNNTFTNVNNFGGIVNFDLGATFNGGNGSVYWNTPNTFNGILGVSTLTSNRTYTLPNATGTIALTSDIVTGYVPYTGATTNVDLGVRSIIGSGGTFTIVNTESLRTNINTYSTDVTLASGNHTALVDANASSRTITLPTASTGNKYTFIIKKTDATANTVTIDGNGSETIDGALTYVISNQWKYVQVQSDGSNWFITGQN